MLKKRLLGVVVVRDGIAVQSIGFHRYLPLGRPEIVVKHLNQWGIDEIAVVDITATRDGRLDAELVGRLARWCQVPLTFGGGIRTPQDMTRIVQAGADKVLVNQAFRRTPNIVREGAELLGAQCIVVSIDVRRNRDGTLRVYDYLTGSSLDGESPAALAASAETLGAGEVFLNFADRDGGKQGYDLAGAADVASAVKVPVILCGGVGLPEHFAAGLAIPNISAVAAGNFFNYTEHSVAVAKGFLAAHTRLRQDTYFNYSDAAFAMLGRVGKKDDAALRELLFEYHAKEVI